MEEIMGYRIGFDIGSTTIKAVVLDENNKISKFDSKHNVRNYWFDNCVNAGFYILGKEICDLVEKPCKLVLE